MTGGGCYNRGGGTDGGGGGGGGRGGRLITRGLINGIFRYGCTTAPVPNNTDAARSAYSLLSFTSKIAPLKCPQL